MGEKGLYFAAREAEEIGFSIALVYIPQEKDLQFSIMLGSYMVAMGGHFKRKENRARQI